MTGKELWVHVKHHILALQDDLVTMDRTIASLQALNSRDIESKKSGKSIIGNEFSAAMKEILYLRFHIAYSLSVYQSQLHDIQQVNHLDDTGEEDPTGL